MRDNTQYVSELMLISSHIFKGLNHLPHHNATPPPPYNAKKWPMLALYGDSTVYKIHPLTF